MDQLAQIIQRNVLAATVYHETTVLIVWNISGDTTRNFLALLCQLKDALHTPKRGSLVLGRQHDAIFCDSQLIAFGTQFLVLFNLDVNTVWLALSFLCLCTQRYPLHKIMCNGF